MAMVDSKLDDTQLQRGRRQCCQDIGACKQELQENGWSFERFVRCRVHISKFVKSLAVESMLPGSRGAIMKLALFSGSDRANNSAARIAMVVFVSDRPIFQAFAEYAVTDQDVDGGVVEFPCSVLPNCWALVESRLPQVTATFPATHGKLMCWRNTAWATQLLTCSGVCPRTGEWSAQELKYSFACLEEPELPFGLLKVEGPVGEPFALTPPRARSGQARAGAARDRAARAGDPTRQPQGGARADVAIAHAPAGSQPGPLAPDAVDVDQPHQQDNADDAALSDDRAGLDDDDHHDDPEAANQLEVLDAANHQEILKILAEASREEERAGEVVEDPRDAEVEQDDVAPPPPPVVPDIPTIRLGPLAQVYLGDAEIGKIQVFGSFGTTYKGICRKHLSCWHMISYGKVGVKQVERMLCTWIAVGQTCDKETHQLCRKHSEESWLEAWSSRSS